MSDYKIKTNKPAIQPNPSTTTPQTFPDKQTNKTPLSAAELAAQTGYGALAQPTFSFVTMPNEDNAPVATTISGTTTTATDATKAAYQAWFAGLSTSQQQALETTMQKLLQATSGSGAAPSFVANSSGSTATPASGTVAVSSPNVTQLTQQLGQQVTADVASNPSLDYDTVLMNLSDQSLGPVEAQITTLTQQMQNTNSQVTALQGSVAGLQNTLSNWPAGANTVPVTYDSVNPTTGQITSTTQTVTQAQLSSLITTLQDQEQATEGMTQQQQLEMQNLSNQYSQIFSTLSNLMKAQDDTIKGIISNIGQI